MKPKISIIVPIYNVEKYLRKCIESILNQTFKEFELILINDGSSDKCGEICDKYAKKDKRIKVIHKKNGGQSSARNVGLDIAQGDYVGFVDSDDWIDIDMYEVLYDLIKKSGKEIANISIKSIEVLEEKILFNHKKIVLNKEESIIELFNHRLYGNFFCPNLFHKSLFKEKRFKEGVAYEDVDLLYKLIHSSNGIVTLGEPKYNYLIREGSTTSTDKTKIYFYKAIEKQKKWLKKYYPILYKNIETKLNDTMNKCALAYLCYLIKNNEICNNLERFYECSRFTNTYFRDNISSKELIWKAKVILILLKISPSLFTKIIKIIK